MLPSTFVGDSIAHISAGLPFIVYGLYILLTSFNSGLIWKRKAEYIAFTMIAFAELVGPVIMIFNSSDCAYSIECFQRNIIHVLSGLYVLLCIIWAIILRKYAPTVFDFAIPLAGIIPGYFLMTHDHIMTNGDPIDMAVGSLHQASTGFMIISSILRIIIDFYPRISVLYSISIGCIGLLLFVTSPVIVHPAVSSAQFNGPNLVFLCITIITTFHAIVFSILLYLNSRYHYYSEISLESVRVH